ncbi:MAG: transposase [Ilumatobacteraceae bacterium]
MARRPRDVTASMWFHVVNRGIDRQDIFHTDDDRALFEALVGESLERRHVRLHAYALMSNHFHLLLECPTGGLSETVQLLCGRYGAAYNHRTSRTGPLFGSRFHSVPIIDDPQLVMTARYIHRNPLAFVPRGALDSYRWSSLSALVGRRAMPTWLSQGIVVRSTDDPHEYTRFVLDPQPADAHVADAVTSWSSPTCADIVRAIIELTGCAPDDVRRGRRGSTQMLRVMAVTLAVELRVADPGSIADYFTADPRTIRRLAGRGRAALGNDAHFGRLRERILSRLRECPPGSVPGGHSLAG